MFTDEHTLDYSSPPILDVYADDFLEVESDAENIYNDPFDSKGEKIKESKLLIDELDLPCDFHPPPETPTSWLYLITTFTPLINSSMEELGQAQRPKTSASWEAPHAY
nr:hypothetical protein [Tanacetum cinerariifolium]